MPSPHPFVSIPPINIAPGLLNYMFQSISKRQAELDRHLYHQRRLLRKLRRTEETKQVHFLLNIIVCIAFNVAYMHDVRVRMGAYLYRALSITLFPVFLIAHLFFICMLYLNLSISLSIQPSFCPSSTFSPFLPSIMFLPSH